MDVFSNLSGVGLAALVVILGYYLIIKLARLAQQHYERQELILQSILIEQIAASERLLAIQESLSSASNDDSS